MVKNKKCIQLGEWCSVKDLKDGDLILCREELVRFSQHRLIYPEQTVSLCFLYGYSLDYRPGVEQLIECQPKVRRVKWISG